MDMAKMAEMVEMFEMLEAMKAAKAAKAGTSTVSTVAPGVPTTPPPPPPAEKAEGVPPISWQGKDYHARPTKDREHGKGWVTLPIGVDKDGQPMTDEFFVGRQTSRKGDVIVNGYQITAPYTPRKFLTLYLHPAVWQTMQEGFERGDVVMVPFVKYDPDRVTLTTMPEAPAPPPAAPKARKARKS
jgi:hypothetical protein